MFDIHYLPPDQALPYQRFTYSSLRERLIQPRKERESYPLIAFGACFFQEPVGLVTAVLTRTEKGLLMAAVTSLFVEERFRRLGIGVSLIRHITSFCAAQGAESAYLEYFALRDTAALERVLNKAGWSPSYVYSKHYRFEMKHVRDARWVHRFQIPSRFRVVPWEEVSHEELEQLVGLESESGYKEYFHPARQEASIVRSCSFILLSGSDIAGWTIVDQELPDTLVYRALYVRQAYRVAGIGPALAALTSKRAIETNVPFATIQVVDANEPMQKITERLIVPLQPKITEYRKSSIKLNSSR